MGGKLEVGKLTFSIQSKEEYDDDSIMKGKLRQASIEAGFDLEADADRSVEPTITLTDGTVIMNDEAESYFGDSSNYPMTVQVGFKMKKAVKEKEGREKKESEEKEKKKKEQQEK